MLPLPHIFQKLLAAGDGEGIGPFLIIVLLVVGRIIKEVLERRVDRSPRDPADEPYLDPGSAEDPMDPLRRFLKELQEESGGRVPTPPPLGSQGSVPARAAQVNTSQAGGRASPRAAKKPPSLARRTSAPRRPGSQSSVPAHHPGRAIPSGHAAQVSTGAANIQAAPKPSIPVNQSQKRLVELLSSPGRQREAILLREVLGPPLALRRQSERE